MTDWEPNGDWTWSELEYEARIHIAALLAERDAARQALSRIAAEAECPIAGQVVSKHGGQFCAKHIALNALADLDSSSVESADKSDSSSGGSDGTGKEPSANG